MNQPSSAAYSDVFDRAATSEVKDTLVIHLHVAIPSAKENRIVPLTAWSAMKIRMHRLLDWSAWLLVRKFVFKSHNYTSREYSNRGDIAIKLVIKELLRARFSDRKVVFTETEWGKLDPLSVAQINREASLFVIAGGGYWVFDHLQRLSPSFLADFPYFDQIACPLAVLGSGVNFNMPSADAVISFDIDPQLRATLLRFDHRVDLLAVRCRSSYEFFQSLGMQKTSLLCDPAVFKEMPVATLPKASNETLAIGINLAFHGQFVEHLLRQNILIYIAFLKKISQHFQCRFYYFIQSDEEFLMVSLLRSAGIKLQVVDVPANDLADAYRQVDVLLCQMMHANILSFCAGVPALNIAYDSKNIGFNELIGMEEFCISAYSVSVENLFERMTRLIEQRVDLKTRIVARKEEMHLDMQYTLDMLSVLVANYSNARHCASAIKK